MPRVAGSRPGLVTITGVELCRVGTWATSTGVFDFTLDDFAAAVAAQADPNIPAAAIKIGHTDPRFDLGLDGEPAYGWVRNIGVAGDRLLGDLVDMPEGLANLVDTAYPRRSIEMGFQVHTPAGARYRAAVLGVALLGVSKPAVAGLADIAALYDGTQAFQVAAAAAALCDGGRAWAVGPLDPSHTAARHAIAGLCARAGVDGSFMLAGVDELAAMPPAYLPVSLPPAAAVSTVPGHAAPAASGGLTMPQPITDARVRELLALAGEADAEAAIVSLRDRAAAAPPVPPPAPPAPTVVPGMGPFIPGTLLPGMPGYVAPTPPAPPVGAVVPPPAAPVPPVPPVTAPPAPTATAPPPPAAPAAPAAAAPPPAAPPAAAPPADAIGAIAAAVAAQLAPTIAAAAAPGAQVAETMRVRDRETMLSAHARRGAVRPADLDYWRGQYDTNPAGTIAHLAASPAMFPTFEIGGAGTPADSAAQTEAADAEFLKSCGITY